MNLETLNNLIKSLEGPRSLREDKYYEALCFLRDAFLHPNFAMIMTAQQNAVLSGKEFMSIDADGIITNLDRKSVTLIVNPCDHDFTIN
jgi:hypothetical protein